MDQLDESVLEHRKWSEAGDGWIRTSGLGSFASGLWGRRVGTHRGESTPPDTVAEKKDIFSGFNPDNEETGAQPEPPGRVNHCGT
jgi:hypothetical protein